MALLGDEEVRDFLGGHPEWSREGDAITRTYRFEDFNQAMGFVTRVALAAEEADHHPDIDIRWNRVTLTWSTHSEGGLTGKDVELAERCDGLA